MPVPLPSTVTGSAWLELSCGVRSSVKASAVVCGNAEGASAASSARRAERVDRGLRVCRAFPPSLASLPSCLAFLGFAGWDRDAKGRTHQACFVSTIARESRSSPCRFSGVLAYQGCSRMPTASRERWRLVLPPALSRVAAGVGVTRTDSPLSSGKASVVGRTHNNFPA